ncbi:MAG: prepilin-type N-terminal cleavage/methylation domain-containing protein [Candidatus Acidiferrales bacterium]
MKREAGFTLVEVLIAITVMLIIVGATLGTLTEAMHATEGVTLMADTQENLRAGMNYISRDLIQAGEGIPQGGITIPNNGATSAVNRPGPVIGAAAGTFDTNLTALPPVIAGYRLGPITTTSGTASDIVTILYADTTLVDANNHWLNEYPIKGPSGTAGCAAGNANPDPAGTIVTAGTTTTVTFDTTCIVINNGNTGINAGDLIMLQNNNTIGSDSDLTASDANTSDSTGSVALLTVSSINAAANSITFSASDAFNLNNSGQTSGTISQIQLPVGSGTYPTTTATRVWMITYYIDNTNPQRPMLMRQTNLNTPQAVGEVIENFQIFYDILNAGSSPPSVATGQESPTNAQLPYIRDAYVVLFARSESRGSQTQQYFRNNLSSVVSMRAMDFYNEFTN